MNCLALPPPTAADIHAAAQRLQGVAHRTPVLRSGMADKLLGELHIGLSEALDTQVLERIGAAIGVSSFSVQ